MNISIWISILISLICLFFVVIYPLFLKPVTALANSNDSESFNREIEILEKLQELETDFKMGKISKEDFDSMQAIVQRELLKSDTD